MGDRTEYFKKWRKKNRMRLSLLYHRENKARINKNKRTRKERNREIIKYFINGMQISVLCKEYGFSQERCRQILIEGMNSKKYKKQKNKNIKNRREEKINRKIKLLLPLCKRLGRIPYFKEVIKLKHKITTREYSYIRLKLIKYGHKTIEQTKKEMLLNDLKKMAIKLNKIPSATYVNEKSNHWVNNYQYYFGSFSNAQKLVKKLLNGKSKTQ